MAGSLADQLIQHQHASRSRIPPESLAIMDAASAEVAASGAARGAVGVGDRAPSFVLPDQNGAQVSLHSMLSGGPVVLSFYRGGWCPYCSLELRALMAHQPQIAAAGATLVAVSPQTPDASASTADQLDLDFPVLSDSGNQVAESFGLVFTLPEPLGRLYEQMGNDLAATNGDQTMRLPVPATYLIRPGGTIAWGFVDPDYTKRAEPTDVIAALEAL